MVKYIFNYWRNQMADNARKNLDIKFPPPMNISGRISGSEVTNLMLYKALNKMEYFRTRCVEMEEKHGFDFTRFKERIDSGEEGKFDNWDELVLWEEYFNSFKEWKSKYEELNRFLK